LGLNAKLASPQQLRQLGDVHRDPPRLVALCSSAKSTSLCAD
jgi:hypothetical protein